MSNELLFHFISTLGGNTWKAGILPLLCIPVHILLFLRQGLTKLLRLASTHDYHEGRISVPRMQSLGCEQTVGCLLRS